MMCTDMCCRFSVFHSIKASKNNCSGNVVIHFTLFDNSQQRKKKKEGPKTETHYFMKILYKEKY